MTLLMLDFYADEIEFQAALARAEHEADTTKEIRFLKDLRSDFEKCGRNVQMTQEQYEHLEQLASRWGGY